MLAMSLKIGFDARCLQKKRSGIAVYLYSVIKNLLMLEPNNDYVLFSPQQENRLAFINKTLSVKERISFAWINLKEGTLISQLLKVFWEKIYLSFEIRREAVDIFHGPAFSLPFFISVPCVVNVHDTSFLRFPAGHTWRTSIYFKIFLKWVLRRADRVLALSENAKKDILHYYAIAPAKVVVVYPGVDEYYCKLSDTAVVQQVKNKFGIKTNYVLSVSAINPRKNISTILKALKQLVENQTPVQLVIVGRKAWLYQSLEEEIDRLQLQPYLIFTGHVTQEELRALYNGATCLAFPSLDEGFGLPLLEAMACGTPVITSNVSSMPEVVGDAGILIAPLDYNALSLGILQLILDLDVRNGLIAKGFERVKKFEWKRTAAQLLKIYRGLGCRMDYE